MHLWTFEQIKTLIFASLLLALGILFAMTVRNFSKIFFTKHFSQHLALITSRISFYLILLLFLVMSLEQLGFNLNVLLGAAGIFTVGLSFASQTAASNLISGIFLLFEQPFKIGDTIEVNGTTGKVVTIDFLSTKIQTTNNVLVRIGNEALMKSEINNLSYFQERSIEIDLALTYQTNFEAVKQKLLSLVKQHASVLVNPRPSVTIDQLHQQYLLIKLKVWAKQEDIGNLTFSLKEMIAQTLTQEQLTLDSTITVHKV